MIKRQTSVSRGRKGQTLAEFAITLPILLVLVFGVIEFARIFQAWVTLQNSARNAARYASTGLYDIQKYVMDTDAAAPFDDPNSFIPCVTADSRGSRLTFDPVTGSVGEEIDYYNGQEGIFATWYDGLNCDPTQEDHQSMRKDLARLFSIMDAARIGAAGLSLEPTPPAGSIPTPAGLRELLLWEVWTRPMPRSSTQGWFNVMICSTRSARDPFATFVNSTQQTRFRTILDTSGTNPTGSYDQRAPVCLLNEIPTSTVLAAGGLDNSGQPWLDAGGPGDGVTVAVTFNHPLITPLGLAPYVQLQARRTAVNEAFRTARALQAFQGGGPIGVVLDTATPLPTSTNTLTPTNTLTRTATATVTSTPTLTPTQPFSCNLLSISSAAVSGNTLFVNFMNTNNLQVTLNRVILSWTKPTQFPNMAVSQMVLNNEIHWQGNDATNADGTDTQRDQTWRPGADRTLRPVSPTFDGETTWSAVFLNGPASMQNYYNQLSFQNSEFRFSNPAGGAECVLRLNWTTPTATPGPSPTATDRQNANCNPNNIQFIPISFNTFGVVEWTLINQNPIPLNLSGAQIQWTRRSNGMFLERLWIGGNGPGDPNTIKVWEHQTSGQDSQPPSTLGQTGGNRNPEGTWLTNYTIDVNQGVSLFMDFGGTVSNVSAAFGVDWSDFNGTSFHFDNAGQGTCSRTVQARPTPTPQPTSGPTNTPSNTPTRTPVTPSRTPTNTYTPTRFMTATLTPVPSNTFTPSPTTPPPPPTVGCVGAVEGGNGCATRAP